MPISATANHAYLLSFLITSGKKIDITVRTSRSWYIIYQVFIFAHTENQTKNQYLIFSK